MVPDVELLKVGCLSTRCSHEGAVSLRVLRQWDGRALDADIAEQEGQSMQLMRILGRSLVDSFCEYVMPLVGPGGDYGVDAAPVPPEVSDLHDRAVSAVGEMALSEARDCLEQVRSGAGHFLGARLLLAAVLSDLGHTAPARDLLDHLLVEAFDDGRLWFLSGQLAERCGEVERAIECYDSAMDRGGRSACEAGERLAAVYLATEDYARGRAKLEWLVAARPEEFRVRVELAGLLTLMGDNEAAVRAYQDAILLEPDNWEVHTDLAASLEAEGRLSEALAELRLVLDEHGGFADLQLRAARLCGKLDDLHGATRHVDAALEANPRYLEAVVFKGMVLTQLGDHRAAVAAFHRAIEVNEEYLLAYAGLALALERSGQETAAADTMELADTIAPGSEAIYARLADAGLKAAMALGRPAPEKVGRLSSGDGYNRLGGQRPALQDAIQGSATSPGDHDAMMRTQLAKHRQAVERYPRYADLRYYYGLLLSSLGRWDEALEQYRAAAEINPHYVEALVRLAVAYWRNGRPDEARHALEKASQGTASDLSTHYGFGLLWADRGLWPLVMERLRRRGASPSAHEIAGAAVAATQNLGVAEAQHRRYLSSLNLTDHRDRKAPSPV